MLLITYQSVVFSYYHRLSPSQRRIYDRSDEITALRLPEVLTLQPLVATLAAALSAEKGPLAEHLCQKMADEITVRLRVPPVHVELLAVRPADNWGELHGLYTPPTKRRRATIQVWIRTARHKRIVAFRTFLRTLLHELCHHLDYELLQLPDSFHTPGFYKRVSSLFNQLLPVG